MAETQEWHVLYSSEDTSEFGHSVDGLSIGPYEDDHADAFAFSQTFYDGEIPDALVATFTLMAAAPCLLAACQQYVDSQTMSADDYERKYYPFAGPTCLLAVVRKAVAKATDVAPR